MKEEKWKPIAQFLNKYEVSTWGRVRNIKSKKIKIPFKNNGRCFRVRVLINGKYYKAFVHQLVANAFLPKPRPNQRYVIHINKDLFDNRVENLKWATFKDCIIHRRGRQVIQYSLDGKYIRTWDYIRQVERELGYHRQNISKVCQGKYKQAYGFIWKYKFNVEENATLW